MATTDQNTSYSVTPTGKNGITAKHIARKSDDLGRGSFRPLTKETRSLSNSSLQHGQKEALAALSGSALPGSFNTELRGTLPTRSGTPRPTLSAMPSSFLSGIGKEDDGQFLSEQRQAVVREKITKEMKIKLGTENMLEALLAKNSKQTREQRARVEQELGTSNRKLAELRLELDEIQRAQTPSTPPSNRMSSYFRGSPLKSPPQPTDVNVEEATLFDEESPTIVLTETLQALEIEGMLPDYYIDRANTLVELFKRNPTLKYDLAWSVFSLRVQMMLLSDSSDVVAAGYRLTRYAIADRSSLKTIRSLHTDAIVILSLVKKGKAILEREQAVKFVRAFLDVKDGCHEISRGVVRSIVAVAEESDDRLSNMCLLTLSEMLMKFPPLVVYADGINVLTDALTTGSFAASESLVTSFLHTFDAPSRRKYLRTGTELEAIFAAFSDPLTLLDNDESLKTCARAVSCILKSWSGVLTLLRHDAVALRALLESLQYPNPASRDLILELLFDVLRIKAPSWSGTFLAGRRLTTYGRVALTDGDAKKPEVNAEERDDHRIDLTSHFSALLLATLVNVGLIPALSSMIQVEDDLALKRKATLLLTEVLKLANSVLPARLSSRLQVLGNLLPSPNPIQSEEQAGNTAMIFQIESINRTLNRSAVANTTKHSLTTELAVAPQAVEKSRYTASIDAEQFKQAMIDTQVPGHSSYMKWKWDLIHQLIEGPLTNPKRLEDAMRYGKFMRRIESFYAPFKYRFALVRNTRPNQRYVRTGCALMRTLTQSSLGIAYLTESKLLRQMAECLAQIDTQSGITSATPIFERHQMAETLSGGYFAMLGALTSSPEGLAMMSRWHIMNMFYHIVEQRDREDLVRTLLTNLDFSLDSHLRILLSQALTSGPKSIRLVATKLLRRYVASPGLNGRNLRVEVVAHWALRLVLTQLYDPHIEVGEAAIRILEEACNQPRNLDFVVKCRPSLDHLGEIGAPLLLRFLSTSIGYHYLNGLDYITQEMDDWFLGRNDSYVALVEASLAKAYVDQAGQRSTFGEDPVDFYDVGLVPPHFYRELARTGEGCKLLDRSGHFLEFASTIRDFELHEEDSESLTRVKGCLWAVGNVGSMELGAPFLEESDIVPAIIRIAEGAEVVSMRGTAYFVLGLISRSRHGFEMLLENDWDTALDVRDNSLGLCIPNDLSRLCQIKFDGERSAEHIDAAQSERYKAATADSDGVNAKVLKSIVEMGNSVMHKKSAGELRQLRARYPDTFKQAALFQKALTILEGHHYRLPSRQFVLDLFDKSVMRQVVLEEESSEDDNTESDRG